MRNGDVSFSHFAQLYRSLMFDAQKNVSAIIYVSTDSSVPALSSPTTPSDALPKRPSLTICPFSNGCRINMDQLKTHQTPLGEAIRTSTHTLTGVEAGRLGSD